MPKNKDAKTASARKTRHRRTLVGFTALVLVVISSFGVWHTLHSSATVCTESYRNDKTVTLHDTEVKAEVVDTPSAQVQGLSGKRCLPADQTMLFVFDRDDDYCFWMKDMNFPIDIIWLNSKKNVVSIITGAQPSTYPKNFCPGYPTRYVLEMPAGTVGRTETTYGDTIDF